MVRSRELWIFQPFKKRIDSSTAGWCYAVAGLVVKLGKTAYSLLATHEMLVAVLRALTASHSILVHECKDPPIENSNPLVLNVCLGPQSVQPPYNERRNDRELGLILRAFAI